MPSTYTLNNGIELIGTGEQSGTWGDTTNTNFELLDTALDGQVSVTLAATGSSGSPNTLPISDGASSNGRNRLVIFGDGGDLGGTAFVQLTPNDAEKIIYVRNNLAGSRSILLFQGTYSASNDYEVPAGTTAVVFFNGAGSGAVAANVFNNAFFDSLRLGSVSVTAILDEDNMASNSATALSTQQSIKAYVDSQVGTVDTLAEILANGNTTGGTDLAVSTGDDITFADSSKAIFGAGSDLQIYHDGSHSRILDSGTGDLYLQGNNLYLTNAAGNNYFGAISGGAASLYHNNALKLATTSTGVDITGNLTAGYLAVGTTSDSYSQILINSSTTGESELRMGDTDTDAGSVSYTNSNDTMTFRAAAGTKMALNSTGLDVTGTLTSDGLTVNSGTNNTVAKFESSDAGAFIILEDSGSTNDGNRIAVEGDVMSFATGDSERMRITSSGSVGINDSSPDGKLNVVSTAHNNGSIFDSTGTTQLWLRDTDAASNQKNWGFQVSGGSLNILRANDDRASGFVTPIEIQQAPANSLVINSSGSVGIGTSSNLLSGSNRTTVSINNTSSAAIAFGVNGTREGHIYSDTSALEISSASNPMRFTAGDSERMRIDSSGNVGIGTTSPSSRLDVFGASDGTIATFGNGQDNAYLMLQAAANYGSDNSLDNKWSLRWRGRPNAGGHSLAFYDEENSAERMRIDAYGNVGIGTSSVTAGFVLEGVGDARFGDVAGDDAVEIGWSGGGSYAFVQAFDRGATAQRDLVLNSSLRIDSSGRVGIGITPAAVSDSTGADSLQLGGTFLIHYDEDGSGTTTLGNNIYFNGTANKALFYGYTSQYYQAGGTHVWRNSGITSAGSTATMSESMRIDSSGNVGIGTSSPSTRLTVGAGAGTEEIRVDAGAGWADLTLNSNSTNGGHIYFNDGSNAGEIFYYHVSDYMAFNTAGTERMRIDSSGNVGINGTPSASDGVFKLIQIGGANKYATFGAQANGAFAALMGSNFYYNGGWKRTDAGRVTKIETGPDSSSEELFSFRYAGDGAADSAISWSEAMCIDSSGNVGIGLSSGLSGLNVNGAVRSQNSSSNISYVGFTSYTGSSAAGAMYSYVGGDGRNTGYLNFSTNDTERMRIDSSGRAMIGTTSVFVGSGITPNLTVQNSGGSAIGANGIGASEVGLGTRPSANHTYYAGYFLNSSGTGVGSIQVTPTSTAFNTSSDYRLKENVVELTGATDRLKQLNPSRFNFIADPDTTVDGFLAHEVQDIVPEAIHGTKDEVDADGNPVYQGIDQSKLVPLLVATIKELEARITALENA